MTNASRRLVIGGAIALAVIAAGAGAAMHAGYPSSDNAMFEFGGRAIVRGARLYLDVWDNKLPGVFLVDAVWQHLFGERYLLHTIAESAVGLMTSALIAVTIARFGRTSWPFALAAAALVLCIAPSQLNAVECYAAPLLVLAVLAMRAERAALAGILTAAATAFWIPAVLTVAPLAMRTRGPARTRAIIGTAIGIAAIALIVVVAIGTGPALDLVRSWIAYVPAATKPVHQRLPLLGPVLDFGDGMIGAGCASLAILVAASVRRPADADRRFALAWLAAALAGTLIGTRFYDHYFIPSVAPMLLVLALFGPPRPRLRTAAIALAMFAAVLTARRAVALAGSHDPRIEPLGFALHRALGLNTTIAVADDYAPGVYLAADPRLRDPYEIVAGPNAAFLSTIRRPRDEPPASIVFISAGTAAPAGYRAVCAKTAAPHRVYVDSLLAKRFDRCP